MEWFTLWFSTFGLLFALIDPLGYVPLFLSITARDSRLKRREMLKRACSAAFLVLSLFTFFGSRILKFFSISIPALQISGGLLLLSIGYEMLKVAPIGEKLSPEEENEALRKEDVSIVPLAVPMLAGPASIIAVIVLSSKVSGVLGYFEILSAVFANLLITYLVLRSADRVLKYVGMSGINVFTRIMGLLLCAVAIQYVIDGYVGIGK